MSHQHSIARELINKQIAPEEERVYMTWMAARPADEVKAKREYGAAVAQKWLQVGERALSRSMSRSDAIPQVRRSRPFDFGGNPVPRHRRPDLA